MNLPNKISIFRMCCMPVMVLLFFLPIPFGIGIFCALFVYVIGSISDAVDGHIARKYNLITDFGKFIDQIADKALSTAALIMVLFAGVVSWNWACALVLIIIVSRDVIVGGVRQVAANKGVVIAAGWTGKIKSNFIDVGVGILITYVGLTKVLKDCGASIKFISYIGFASVVVGAVLSLISCIEYILKAAPLLKEKDDKNA